MSIDLHRVAPRRSAIVLLTALCLVVPAFLGLTSSATAAGGSAAYDRSINEGTCDLLGRAYTKGAGCSRTRCVAGAQLFRKVFGAEACQLKGQGDYGFVSTIDYRTCAALGRRWIRQVNFCASYPDRSVTAVYDAPQCRGARSVYVRNTEADGFYDECLTPARVNELVGFARTAGSDLTAEASLRSGVQCEHRPAASYVDGRCVSDPGSVPAKGGVLMVGDSLTWRGSDELGKMRRTFTLDGEPARQISELQGRLDYYVSGHGQPTGLIIALGAVPPPANYGKSDLARTVKSVPRSTKIMFVLPYAALPSGKTSPRTTKIGGWMKAIAKSRGRACVAPWPSFVVSHRGLLQDGVHVKHSQEKTWAKFIDQQWGRC
jgi:hypothetical protein